MGIYICVPDMTCTQIFSKYGVQSFFPNTPFGSVGQESQWFVYCFFCFLHSFLSLPLSSASPLCALYVSPLMMASTNELSLLVALLCTTSCIHIKLPMYNGRDFRHGLRFSQAFSSVGNANRSKSLNRQLFLPLGSLFHATVHDREPASASFSQRDSRLVATPPFSSVNEAFMACSIFYLIFGMH
ncbi:hypothetical protein BDZ97DRAFT_1888983 [Flammula alnicola]|nr:hypothetical protein BDZ97DRAFT_1888983 [Flammula alnicola]